MGEGTKGVREVKEEGKGSGRGRGLEWEGSSELEEALGVRDSGRAGKRKEG